MATLQAARARALGLPADSARSWGLNRAVHEHYLGDDKAFAVTVGGRTLFTIGGEIQEPEDFRRQIEARFAGTFAEAWKEAMGVIAAHPKDVLESQDGFYMKVYRPRRDALAATWNERAEKQATS